MVGSTSKSDSLSLKEYLKRYETTIEDPKKKKKKKKSKPDSTGVRIVDEDPVWQKPVKIEEEDNDSVDEEKPQINEDIEVKRMKRLEEIRLRRPYLAVSEDGSGWVSISNDSKESHSNDAAMLSPEPLLSNSDSKSADLSPPQRQQAHSNSVNETFDLSPPRRRQKRRDTPSPGQPSSHLDHDLSSPRRSRTETNSVDAVPDMSPPRRRQRRADTPSPEPEAKQPNSVSANRDLSPPRRSRTQISSPDLSPPRRGPRQTTEIEKSHVSSVADLSPPRKNKNDSSSAKMARRAGLFSGKEIKEEIDKKRKEELLRFSEMDPSISGRGAEAVYRDKHGKRISKEEYFKLNQGEEKPKEKKLEWGKGLAQKREAEAREHELELEKEKPFARTRDDPELDKMLKERVRWGDPMAHLVKPKNTEPLLEDLGESEKMKESGFVIPQTIPSHSWIKRGIDPPANRYGIKPGRHWDGVDRSNGYEKESFKRQNEKQATEREAYLWSVSEM